MKKIKLIDQSIDLFDNIYRSNIDKDKDLTNNYIYLGYFMNDHLIAFLSFIYLIDNIDLDYIVVQEDMQGQKVGFELIKYLIDNYQFNLINIEVNENNKKAISLYQKTGFKLVNVRNKYYGNENALIMQYIKE